MDYLTNIDTLMISQKVEMGEVLTGFEGKNKYSISETNGRSLFYAFESGGSLLGRLFLKALRAFEMQVVDNQKAPYITVKRPFRWFFQEASVFDDTNRFLGKIKMNFSVFTREYSVYDANGMELFSIHGPFFHPWTFEIIDNGEKVGKISKKWSGLLKEAFSDADNFGIQFPMNWDMDKKKVALGAVFLIDFMYFENSGSRN